MINSFLSVKTDLTHTIGAEFGSKIVNVNQKNVKLQIWDVRWIFMIKTNIGTEFFFRSDGRTRTFSICDAKLLSGRVWRSSRLWHRQVRRDEKSIRFLFSQRNILRKSRFQTNWKTNLLTLKYFGRKICLVWFSHRNLVVKVMPPWRIGFLTLAI